MNAPDLRPRSVPQLIDDSVSLWRELFLPLLGVAAATYVAQRLLDGALGLVLPALRTPSVHWVRFEWDTGHEHRFAGLLSDFGPNLLFGLWVSVMTNRWAGLRRLGRSESVPQLLAYATRRLPAILWAYVKISLTGVLAAVIASVVLGVPAFVIAVIADLAGKKTTGGFLVTIVFVVVLQVVLVAVNRGAWLEGAQIGLGEALGTSGRRSVLPRWGHGRMRQELRLLALLLLFVAATWGVFLIAHSAVAGLHLAIPAVSGAERLVWELTHLVDQALPDTASTCAAVIFFFDLSARTQGVDLALALGEEPAREVA